MNALRTIILPLTLISTVILNLSGCASTIGHVVNPCPYSGVKLDVKSWHAVGPLVILDLPFSAVMDTVLLPIDLINNRDCNW